MCNASQWTVRRFPIRPGTSQRREGYHRDLVIRFKIKRRAENHPLLTAAAKVSKKAIEQRNPGCGFLGNEIPDVVSLQKFKHNFRTEQSRPATNLTEKKLQKVEVTGPTTWLQARKVKPGVLLFEKFATGCELRTNFIELYSVPRKLFCLTRSINFDCLLCGYGRH